MIERCQDGKIEAKAIVAWAQLLMKDYGWQPRDLRGAIQTPDPVRAVSRGHPHL